MGRTAALLVALLLGGLVQIGTANTALACSCAGPVSDLQAAQRADAVFTGVLLDREVADGIVASSSDPAVLTFRVEAIYQGAVAERQAIVTARDGASCGLELSGPGPHLVFARTEAFPFEPDAADGALRADLCGGSRPLSSGPPDAGLGEPHEASAGTTQDAGDVVDPSRVPLIVLAGAATVTGVGGVLLWRRQRRPA